MRLFVAFVAVVLGPALRADTFLDAEKEGKISELLRESGVPSVSVAIAEHGEVVYAKAFGEAAIAPDREASPSTRYFVGSVSKQFTAAAVLLAAEAGRLSLDDRVAKYYPELTRAGDITIRQLLSHTSGYEDFAPQDYAIPDWARATSPEAVIRAWAGKPLDFEPGTRWQYSNTNYVIAARIFEKATGETLVPFLGRVIFGPLGMTTATDGYLDRRASDAVPYTRYALGPPRPAVPEGPGWYYGAAQLAMTPSDLARWDIAVLHHRILSEKSYRDLTGAVSLRNGDLTHYALGLGIGEMNRIPRIEHSGEVSGFLTSNAIFPTRDTAIVVCSNEDSVNLFETVARQLARWLLKPAGGEAAPAQPAELSQVRSILDGLRGGVVDRSLLTPNLSSYFSPTALGDIQESLKPLGPVKSLDRNFEMLRGGMTFRDYRVGLEKGSLDLTVYQTPDGRFEQFLITQDL
ncbi:MAG TPA: serine hydrolase domain-containing protein [Opitutaceae bacterium]|nr:serine hydrolase domain-containing protein [Opitutaceae bacterium]